MKYYFHGTTKDKAEEIKNSGMAVKNGRATFTQNPEMTLPYAGIGGVILVFKDDGNFKLAVDSDINIDYQNKMISGWVNRYKNEQFGYYSESDAVPRNLLSGEIRPTSILFDLLKQIKKDIIAGDIDQSAIKKYQAEIIKEADVSPEIANACVIGMIRNISLLQIRALELSKYAANGWKIINRGDHEVKLFLISDFDRMEGAVVNLEEKDLLSQDLINEFRKIER